jgi:Lar family restriction alleviation protein
MDNRLKPCPFCGGEALAINSMRGESYDVGCFNGDCPIEPHVWAEIESEAIAAWNTRAKERR